MITPDQLYEARTALIALEEKFLRQRGWKCTCDTPTNLWLWIKEFPNGKRVLVTRETALQMEEHWSQNP